MLSRQRLAGTVALILIAIFLCVLANSVLRRAENSHSYPDYSSLNNGANGTKAFYDALARLGFDVSRNYGPQYKLAGRRADIFCFGMALSSLPALADETFSGYAPLARSGDRLVLAFDPEAMAPRSVPLSPGKAHVRDNDEKALDDLSKNWGIQLEYRKRQVGDPVFRIPGWDSVTWRFSSWSKEWIASNFEQGSPLMLERKFGQGSLLLVADVKRFTNSDLLLHPDVAVLAALPGPRGPVIFDENHLGVANTGTVIGLASAHRLQWILWGLLGLAVLYVWRSSVSFIPPPGAEGDAAVAGHDGHVALSNLLSQSIPLKALFGKAAEEWNRTQTLRRASRLLTADDVLRATHTAPAAMAAAYNDLTRRLKTKRHREKP
jgi:hypothetical protein